jgi:hypothetical protein
LPWLPAFINTFPPSHQSLPLRGSGIVTTCNCI